QIAAGGDAARTGSQALAQGAAQAAAGARALGDGLATASEGTVQLIDGARSEQAGAARLARGLARAEAGLRDGLPQVDALAKGLEDGAKGLNDLRQPAQIAQKNLEDTMSALDAMLATSKADPQYARAYKGAATALGAISGRDPTTGAKVQADYDGLDAELADASAQLGVAAAGTRQISTRLKELLAGLARLHRGADALRSGAGELGDGLSRLREGEQALGRGAGALAQGAGRLSGGAGELARGLERLAGGGEQLSSGLRSGYEQSGALTDGIGRLQRGSRTFGRRAGKLSGQLGQTRQLGPLFGSGYAVLAALDTAPPSQRQAAGFVVNVDRGGDAAQFVVIKRGNPTHAGDDLRKRLETEADELESATGAKVAVGGPAARLQDFDNALHGSFIKFIVVVSLITYLVLIPILRSLVLPALAVLLNLLTVAAAYGVLVLGFVGDAPLGGPGFIDDLMVAAVSNVVFALSIDYEVFLLMRVREGYSRLGDTDQAIAYALKHTAGVITGAAAIMTAVFFAFALSPVTSMRQLGLGLSVAVILDATVVRLVLLPACLRLAGRWNWWLPAWLDRMLPRIDFEGARARRGSRPGREPRTDW
ncbi:MAG TPA: MMPL family transporter, partial [Thermoleophilaceae bacterium]